MSKETEIANLQKRMLDTKSRLKNAPNDTTRRTLENRYLTEQKRMIDLKLRNK